MTKNRFFTSRVHFWSKIWIFISRAKIDLKPLGTIFGQVLVENWTFDFLTKNRFFYPQGPFLVENSTFSFFDQNLVWDLQATFLGQYSSKIWTFDFWTKNRFLTSKSKKLNFHFSTKNWFETSRHHFWASFGRKIELSIFWPKIDFRPPGSILVKNWNFNFSTKNRF